MVNSKKNSSKTSKPSKALSSTKKAHKPLKWIENLVFLPESGPLLAGKKLKRFLLDFQKDIIRAALTEKGEPNKNIFLGWSRKIGKSQAYAWILHYLLANKRGYNSAILASTSEQAGIIFRMIKEQILFNETINEKDFKITRDRIEHKKNFSSVERLYSNSAGNLGKNLSCICVDELGAQDSSDGYETLLNGLALAHGGKPLILTASNPPPGPEHWSDAFVKTNKENKDWKIFEYASKGKTDPFTPEALRQSNPFFKTYCSDKKKFSYLKGMYDFLTKQSSEAKRSPEAAIHFMRYQLGKKVSCVNTEWINPDNIQIVSLEDVLRIECRIAIGIDLALSVDFSAAAICFCPFDKPDRLYVKPIMHVPGISWRTRKQQLKLREWHQQGFITIQEQEALSKDQFLGDIKNFINKNNIRTPRAVVWDRGLASSTWTDSLKYGKSLLVPGTAYQLSASIRELQAKAKDKRLFLIGDNKAFKWCVSNAIVSSRSKSYCLLNRQSNRHSIDICVATVLAQKWFLENPYKEFLIMSG